MFQINDKLGVTQIIRKEAIKKNVFWESSPLPPPPKKNLFFIPLETETLNKVPK